MFIPQGLRLVTNGTVTQTNMKLATVDAGTMIDIGVDWSAYAGDDAGVTDYMLILYDSAGKRMQGFCGASGGGEAKDALPNDITVITKDDPGVVSSIAHALSVGCLVYFSGLNEMTELNTKYVTVSAIGSVDLFSILDTSGYNEESTGGACGEKVTDISTNGLHFHSTKSGTDQKVASIDSGFDLNDSSGYTYKIYRIY